MAFGGVILEALGAPLTLVDPHAEPRGAQEHRVAQKETACARRTAASVATPQIMPLDLVAWALYRRGRTTEQVAAQTGLDLEQAIEAIIRGFRLTLEEG